MRVAVALSGGADSLALTLLAQDWLAAHGGHLTALTVDHRLRDDSTREAQTVASMMHARGITHYILTPAHTQAGNNRMQAARRWRYDALADFCTAHAIPHCLLGHHRDDQLETVALAHLRGRSTLDLSTARSEGEAGMRPMRLYRGIHFLRPLLDIPKQALTDYLSAEGIMWIEDPTNHDGRYARSRIRAQLAADADLRASIATTLAARATARDARETALALAEPHCISATSDDACQLNLDAWKKLEPELASLMLANIIRQIGKKRTARAAMKPRPC